MDDRTKLTSLSSVHVTQDHHPEHIRNNLKSAKNFASGKSDPRLRAACVEMESLFINYLLKEMRATVNKSGFISGGQAEEIFTSLLDVELSQKISANGGIGLSSILLEQLGGHAAKKDAPDSGGK